MRCSLAGKARDRLKAIRADEATQPSTEGRPTLLEYFARVSVDLERPDWLSPYADVLERAIDGDFRVAVAAPPQHGKTELTLRALLYWAQYWPGRRHAYVTYNQERAHEVAKDFQDLASAAGFEVHGTLRRMRLRLANDPKAKWTVVKFTSVLGTLTGAPIDGVCVIDDPYATYEDARSPTVRRRIQNWWRSVARARRHPGTSYVVMATRWHLDDFSGYTVRELGWRYINLKAIADPAANDDVEPATGRVLSDPLKRRKGESLWPARKPPEFFAEEQRDKFTWHAMYQGEPRPEGGKVFHEIGSVDENGKPTGACWYSELPKGEYRGAFGIDLAYTSATQADWSVCLECIAVGRKLYVLNVVRKQVDGDAFALTLKTKLSQRPGWPMRWYHGGGGEKGVASFMRRMGIAIKAIPAVADKRVRALPVAAAWNNGDVLLPDPAHFKNDWLREFLEVVRDFTGDGDTHDDDVDALAAGYDQLMKKNPMAEALGG